MASYTGLSNLQNNVHRSGFDLSQRKEFSAKVGELLPIYWNLALPSEKYRFKPSYFTRTQPLQTSAYTRIREYFDIFEVPLNLLWKSSLSALTQMGQKNPIEALSLKQNLLVNTGLPSLSLGNLSDMLLYMNGNNHFNNFGVDTQETGGFVPVGPTNYYGVNQFGFSRGSLGFKLLSYLGYGSVDRGTSSGWGVSQWSTSVPSEYFDTSFAQNRLVNIFPILAYQKIYQDFFRWEQWENADPTTYNVDYYDGSPGNFSSIPQSTDDYYKSPTMLDLRYCNYQKDMFMGVLPETQFGDVAAVTATGRYPFADQAVNLQVPAGSIISTIISSINSFGSPTAQDANFPFKLGASAGDSQHKDQYLLDANDDTEHSFTGQTLYAWNATKNFQASIGKSSPLFTGLRSQFSILALRQQEALQRWKEITQSGDYDYKEQIRKHFGVNVPDGLSNLAVWIGGIARDLDISEVVNTNLAADSDMAYINGKGIGSGSGEFSYEVKSHSIIMVTYHAVPLLEYVTTGQDPQLSATDATHIPIPEFDNIGMETVTFLDFFNDGSMSNVINEDLKEAPLLMGYQPRFYAWKTKVDKVCGAFSTTLKDWVSPISMDYFLRQLQYSQSGDWSVTSKYPWFTLMNYNIFKVNPRVMDSIFGVSCNSLWDTDQLLINSYMDVKVVSPYSRDGLPY